MSSLDPELRALLVCPRCRAELLDQPQGLACEDCGLLYRVVDGVPWMIPERARKWRPATKAPQG